MGTLKGQNLRAFVGGSVVAEATNCTITLTGNTEDVNTKDDVSLAAKNAVVSKAWQVSVDSMNVGDIALLINTMKSGTAFALKWDQTDDSDNTTAENASFARTGSAFLTDLTVNFNDREWATKNIQFTGNGALETI